MPVSSQVPSARFVSGLSAALNDGLRRHALLYVSFPEPVVVALLSTLIVTSRLRA